MRNRIVPACYLAGFFVFGALPAAAQQFSIQILATFDYPGVGNSTTPFGINQRGDISGRYADTNGVTRGFVRFRNGTFSPPLVEPNDTGNLTEANDIDLTTVVGDFLDGSDGSSHGYLFSGGVFTQFDVAGAFSTFVEGINRTGNFVGGFVNDGEPEAAFVHLGGNTTTFAISGATNTQALRINALDEAVGQYNAESFDHGFLREPDGTLTFPIDFPGPGSTALYGINDHGLVVGRYTDETGLNHGFVLRLPDTFVEFDYPGAAGTSLNGINNRGVIAGRYADSAGIRHGFVARVIEGSADAAKVHPGASRPALSPAQLRRAIVPEPKG